MTLPSIESTLKARHMVAKSVTESDAKPIVYGAIETDLAAGLAYLEKFMRFNWNVISGQEERCLHCELPDITARKQVIRLAAYHPLRQYVAEKLGLLIALHNFRPTSNDGGPSARIAVVPVNHTLFGGKYQQTRKGNLNLSPAQSWQVMTWGEGPMPELLSSEEASTKIWAYAQTELVEALAHLERTIAEDDSDGLKADGRLIPQMLQLVGVPGIHAVVAQHLGYSFQLYNCCKTKAVPVMSEGNLCTGVEFRIQLQNQASTEMMDC